MAQASLYFLRRRNSNQQIGPMSASELRALARAGKIDPGDSVCKQGSEAWTAASAVKGLLPPATGVGGDFSAGPWLIELGGRRGGPYPLDKIRVLVARGSLPSAARASVDGVVWRPVADIPGAFPVAGTALGSAPPDAGALQAPAIAVQAPSRGFFRTRIARSPRAAVMLVVLMAIVCLTATLFGALVSARQWDAATAHPSSTSESMGNAVGSREVAPDDRSRPVVIDPDATNIDSLIDFPRPKEAIQGLAIGLNDAGELRLDSNNDIISGEQKFPKGTSASIDSELRVRGFRATDDRQIVRLEASRDRVGLRIFRELNPWLRQVGVAASSAALYLVDDAGGKHAAIGLVDDDGTWVTVKCTRAAPLRLSDLPSRPGSDGRRLCLYLSLIHI